MKKLAMTLLLTTVIPATVFGREDWTVIPAREAWRDEIASCRRCGIHGQTYVDLVHRKLGDLPAFHKGSGNCKDLNARLPEVAYDHFSLSESAKEAAGNILNAALSSAALSSRTLNRIVRQASHHIASALDWESVTASGTLNNAVVEVYTPLREADHHILFSAQLRQFELDLIDTTWIGMRYKKARMSGLQGDWGVLYFNTNGGPLKL